MGAAAAPPRATGRAMQRLASSAAAGGVLGAWWGILAGFGEVLLLALRRFGFGHMLWLGRHVIWMAPLTDAALCGLVGLVAGLVAWPLQPAVAARLRVFPVAFVAGWTVTLAAAVIDERAGLLLALGLAVAVARAAGRRPDAAERPARRTMPALVAALSLIGFAIVGGTVWVERWRLAALPAPTAAAPNVLLLILDTVRAPELSAYGYGRETSPQIAALARDGVQFDRAFATAPWTLLSHASLFGGRYADAWDLSWVKPLHRRFPTLAEALRQRGYATGGFVASQYFGAPEFGLSRGFTHYQVYPVTWMEVLLNSALGRRWVNSRRVRALLGEWDIANRKRAPRVNGEFLRWLDGVPADRPFFAFLNYFDAHEPYLPPPPFATRFGPRARPQPATGVSLRNADLDRDARRRLSAAEVAEQRDAYDGAIASVDAAVGALLAELERRGLLGHTVVILAGDHGEGLGEQGRFLHGYDLSAPVLAVPLIVRYPAGGVPTGMHVPTPVSLRDVAATVLELVGGRSGSGIPGFPLSRFWRTSTGGAAVAGSVPFSSFVTPREEAGGHAVVAGRYHFVRGDDGGEMLFDVVADPFETRDLSATPEGRRLAPGLRAVLDSLRRNP